MVLQGWFGRLFCEQVCIILVQWNVEWLNDVGCRAFMANMIGNCQMFLAKLRVRLLNIERNTHIVTKDARCMGNRHSKGTEQVANGQYDLFNGHMHSIKFSTIS
jgi:hypothetical protein